jgi:hypothetical protein
VDFLAFFMPGEGRPMPSARDAARQTARERVEALLARATTRLDGLLALLAADDARDAALLATLLAEDLDEAAAILALPGDGGCGQERARLGLLPDPKHLTAFARLAEARIAAIETALAARKARDWKTAGDRFEARALWRARTALVACVVLLAGVILFGDALAKKRREFVAVVAVERQRKAAADALSDLADLARRAKRRTGTPLLAITGRSCTMCGCQDHDLRTVSDGDVCRRQWSEALERLGRAAGASPEELARLARDPWGSPFLLNENEGESPDFPCVPDVIASAGPNGRAGDGDDIAVAVENVFCRK